MKERRLTQLVAIGMVSANLLEFNLEEGDMNDETGNSDNSGESE